MTRTSRECTRSSAGSAPIYILSVTPHEYRELLLVVIVINTVTSTVVGGYMVETAQANSGSGRLTALRQFVQQACWIAPR